MPIAVFQNWPTRTMHKMSASALWFSWKCMEIDRWVNRVLDCFVPFLDIGKRLQLIGNYVKVLNPWCYVIHTGHPLFICYLHSENYGKKRPWHCAGWADKFEYPDRKLPIQGTRSCILFWKRNTVYAQSVFRHSLKGRITFNKEVGSAPCPFMLNCLTLLCYSSNFHPRLLNNSR